MTEQQLKALKTAEHALNLMLSYHGQGTNPFADVAQSSAVVALALVERALAEGNDESDALPHYVEAAEVRRDSRAGMAYIVPLVLPQVLEHGMKLYAIREKP